MAGQPDGTLPPRRSMLKSKIHRATVTHADVDYEGSLTLDALLLQAANILPYEEVHVWNVTRGTRLRTYAMIGEAGSGIVCVNGAAAHLAQPRRPGHRGDVHADGRRGGATAPADRRARGRTQPRPPGPDDRDRGAADGDEVVLTGRQTNEDRRCADHRPVGRHGGRRLARRHEAGRGPQHDRRGPHRRGAGRRRQRHDQQGPGDGGGRTAAAAPDRRARRRAGARQRKAAAVHVLAGPRRRGRARHQRHRHRPVGPDGQDLQPAGVAPARRLLPHAHQALRLHPVRRTAAAARDAAGRPSPAASRRSSSAGGRSAGATAAPTNC